ncbi:MAG: ROK family protein [bacterium]
MSGGGGHVIGLDLGGTKLAGALFRASGETGSLEFVRARPPMKYDEILGPGGGKIPRAERSRRIEEAMHRFIADLAGGAPAAVDAMGIATAGFIERGIVVEARNTGMINHPLRDNVHGRAGCETYVYKDSWAPVFAVALSEPAIIFSLGTGFGGVSCEADREIKLRSRTVLRKPAWVPKLMANDDPGYAVSFPPAGARRLIAKALDGFNARSPESARARLPAPRLESITAALFDRARRSGKGTPRRTTVVLVKLLAGGAGLNFRPNEVFADFFGAAALPALFYSELTGKPVTPRELDAMLERRDADAVLAALVHAEFIGFILCEMQKERVACGLPPAARIYGTGSGYNTITHAVLGEAVADALADHAAENGLNVPPPGGVHLALCPHPTSLPAFGAAVGAAMGISVG